MAARREIKPRRARPTARPWCASSRRSAALERVPDSRAATEQAIDLRLGLHSALNALGETPGRLLDHLRSAETLVQTLGDHLRLGRVYTSMGSTFWVAGQVDRAIASCQQALAVAVTLGHVGLQAWAHHILGDGLL